MFDQIQAATKAAEIEQERTGLQDQLNSLTDTAAQALTRQRDALDESNRALFDHVQALQDAKQAAEAAQDYQLQALALQGEAGAAELAALQRTIDTKAKLEAGWTQTQISSLYELTAASEAAAKALELANTNKGWQDQLDVLTGVQTDRSIALRDATEASTRALMEQVYAQQDLKAVADERTSLQDQLNQLTLSSADLLNLQRDALDESNRALFDQIQAATKAAEIEQERTGLQDQLNQLTLTSVDLRALEIAKLDESNRPMQERIWLLEEEKRIAEERNGLMSSLYQVLGNTGALRAEQLAKLDPSNHALQEQVWQIEDAKAVLEKALQAESESANAAQQAAQERVSTLQSIFDALKSNVDSLYESVEATKQWTAAQANAFLDNALANAQSTGYMPDADDLTDAISGARAGLDKQYATEFERQRDTLVLAGKLADMRSISGGQLTSAERQLEAAEAQVKALDGLQAQGQAMLDRLNGNVAATLSVRDAIAGLSAAVLIADSAAATGQLGSAYGADSVMAGPALESPGPVRIWNAPQLGGAQLGGALGSGNTARLEALVEGLTKKVEGLQTELKAIRTSTENMAENIDEVTEGGQAIRSRSVGVTA